MKLCFKNDDRMKKNSEAMLKRLFPEKSCKKIDKI